MGDFAAIPWGKQGQCCLAPSGDFAGIPWGKQGQCYLTQSGRSPRSVLSNTKWEILQLFPGVNKVSVV